MAQLWIWDLFSKGCCEGLVWGSHYNWVVSRCLLASCVNVRAVVRLSTKTDKLSLIWETLFPTQGNLLVQFVQKLPELPIANLMVWKQKAQLFVALCTALLGSWLHLEHWRGVCEGQGLAVGQLCCSRCGGSSSLPLGSHHHHRCSWVGQRPSGCTNHWECVLIQMLKSSFELKSVA